MHLIDFSLRFVTVGLHVSVDFRWFKWFTVVIVIICAAVTVTNSGYHVVNLVSFVCLQVLECGVCEDVFSLQGDKVPRLLLCGHTVCHDCLTRLPLHGRAVRCPFDRQVTELGESSSLYSHTIQDL